MSFLLITRRGIYWKRGQSTRRSWTPASRKVIDSLWEEIGAASFSFNRELGIPYLELWISKDLSLSWERELGRGRPLSWRVSSVRRISMRTADHFTPTALLSTCDTSPRGGPQRLMLSTHSVYLWKLHQHVQNMGPQPATSPSPSAHTLPGFPGGWHKRGSRLAGLRQLWATVLLRLIITASV